MPNYEYRCEKCGGQFEVIQKFSDEPLTTHEKCGGRVQRLISAPAFNFKGSGWYVTDYAKGSKPGAKDEKTGKAADNGAAAKADKPAGGSEGGSSASTESKTGSKSEPKSTPPDNK